MAFTVGDSGGYSRRGRGRGGNGALAEINIIPLVDVVLVLLIIFMLTASVMEFGLKVEVPKVRQTSSSVKPLPVIGIAKDGMLYLGDTPVNINLIGQTVRQRFPEAKGVYLRADKGAVWDAVAQVISALGEAKLDVSVVTKTDEPVGSKKR